MKTSYIYKTAIANLLISEEDGYITQVEIVKDAPSENVDESSLTFMAYTQIVEYLNGIRRQFDLPVKIMATPFQEKIYEIVSKIPYGKTLTYREVALQYGAVCYTRAVGTALRFNQLLLIIPCHRVIGTTGKLTGFIGGMEMKEFLLNLERSNIA